MLIFGATMEELLQTFEDVLKAYGNVDIAEAEFKRMLTDDAELHDAYHEWCHEMGHTERHGFLDWAEEYIANQNSIWDSLKDDYDS